MLLLFAAESCALVVGRICLVLLCAVLSVLVARTPHVQAAGCVHICCRSVCMWHVYDDVSRPVSGRQWICKACAPRPEAQPQSFTARRSSTTRPVYQSQRRSVA